MFFFFLNFDSDKQNNVVVKMYKCSKFNILFHGIYRKVSVYIFQYLTEFIFNKKTKN